MQLWITTLSTRSEQRKRILNVRPMYLAALNILHCKWISLNPVHIYRSWLLEWNKLWLSIVYLCYYLTCGMCFSGINRNLLHKTTPIHVDTQEEQKSVHTPNSVSKTKTVEQNPNNYAKMQKHSVPLISSTIHKHLNMCILMYDIGLHQNLSQAKIILCCWLLYISINNDSSQIHRLQLPLRKKTKVNKTKSTQSISNNMIPYRLE